MSGLLGGGQQPGAFTTPKLSAISLQSSAWGGAIPIVYGTTRVSANVIYLPQSDFVGVPQYDRQGVGKGGGSVTQTSWVYSATIMMAIAEGPIAGVNSVWADKDLVPGGLSYYGFSLFTGSRTQTTWTFLSTYHPTNAIGYSGTAYVAAAPIALGSSGALKNFSYEVQGFNIVGGGIQDANPADIVPDLLTNVYYGAGWDPAHIASTSVGPSGGADSSYRRYCLATGFLLSPTIADQRPAAEHIRGLLDASNTEAVFSQGVLKLVPYGDSAITGNGVTYTPYNTPIYDLTNDDFSRSGSEDVIKVTRKPLRDTFNTIPVEFTDRANDYNRSVVQDPEPVDADQYGIRQGGTMALHAIASLNTALAISRIRAQRSCYVRNVYTFRLSWKYILLDPMDLVTLTEPFLGLNQKVVRIRTIVENERGDLTFEAEEWPFGVASSTLYTTQSGDGGIINTAVSPGSVTTPLFFDVPALYGKGNAATANPQVAIATAGGQWWGGANVWVSGDGGTTFAQGGTVTQKARYGVTTSALAAGTGFDTAHTVGVDLSISGGSLTSVSDDSAISLLSLCYLGGELLAPATDTLTGTYAYTMSRIERGAWGTVGASHSSGVPFARMDENVFLYEVPTEWLGRTLLFKFASYNVFGGALEDLAGVSTYTFTPSTSIGVDPPYPASVTLSISGTAPTGSGSTTQRTKALDDVGGTDTTDPLQPGVKPPRYATVTFSPVSINPASLLSGYEVVLYTGADPNNLSTYVVPVVNVGVAGTATVINVPATNTSTTINAAVRAIYGADPSSWRTSTGSVVVSPGTVPLSIPISMAIQQTASDRSTVTFSVTLTDPLLQYTTGTVYVAWSGLTGVVDNVTGLPVAASYTATFGTARSFTATLAPQFRGQGYVRFRTNLTGRADSYVVWQAAQQDQDAAPGTELSIDNAGATAIVVNAPDNTSYVKWLASASAYPSAATVASSGTTASGTSPYRFNLGVTLALGETVYFTGIPYDQFGTAGQTIQGKKYRETITASKTIQFSAGQLVPYQGVVNVDYTQDADGAVRSIYYKAARFTTSFVLPNGCTITNFAVELWQAGTTGVHSEIDLRLQSTSASIAYIASASFSAAWVTISASLSQVTSGERFTIDAQILDVNTTYANDGNARVRAFYVTYTSPNTQATV